MTSPSPAPGTRSQGQTFLVGPNLYLRSVELADAATATIWRKSPYPAPVEVVEEQLNKRFERGIHEEERNQLLIACRRSDDVPVGSVEMWMGGWRFTRLGFTVDPLATDARRDDMLAELLRILVPWTIEERNVMIIGVSTLDNQPLVEQAVADLGGRRASRLREMFLVDGKRRDQHYVQFFNPAWIEKLGMPPAFDEEPVEREVRVPASRRQTLPERGKLARAVAVSDRLYLRPFAEGDGAYIAELSLRETEVVFPEGRWVVNAGAINRTLHAIASVEPAEQVSLAVALRESDELIGVMAFFGIDWVHRTAETASEMFRTEYRGGGYGTEAKHLMLELAFDQLGLHMVQSSVAESNPRSAAALRKQGYRLGGYTAWESFVAGGLCGSWAFDLLADEWREAREAHKGE